jgi:DNA-binding PadR family transcriptional regulator
MHRHHHRQRQHCDFNFAESREHHGPFGRGFGRGGRGFMSGAGLRAARMLASGDLRLIVLALLSEKPRHGYEIIKTVEEHSSGVYTPSPGMVYPALTYLEEMGYATGESEGAKKLYRITEAGAAHLAENRASVEETLDQLARFGRRFAQFQKRYSEETEAAEDAEEDFRGGIKSEWRQAKMEFRELRGELKSLLYEKIDASPEERKRIAAIVRRAIDEIRGKRS